jgi:nucleoside-diphosphate-sugar epimerase
MKILVTGASGRVGKYAILELEQAHELRLFSRRHPREGAHKFETRHPHIAADLLDRDAIRRAVEGVDAIAHIGANAWFSPETFNLNTASTYYLLEACRESGVKRFVMAGSDWGVAKSDARAVPPDYVPVDEAHPCRPCDHYGLSKVVNEVTCEMFAREYGISCAVMRITGVWMPEQTAGHGKKPRPKPADAAQWWWSYVDVRDVARAFRLALEAPALPRYGTYFLSAADTILDVPTMDAVRACWPGAKVIRDLPGNSSVLSGEAAFKGFGWRPAHSWRKG